MICRGCHARNRMLALILFLVYGTVSYASIEEDHVFRQLTVKDGLSDNRVRNIGMTYDGRMCFRTNTILNVYNGSAFSYFRFDSREIVYTGYTGYYDMQFGADGLLWLKTVDNLWYFDLNTEKFCYDTRLFFDGLGLSVPVSEVIVDNSGDYWVVSLAGSLYYYDKKGKKEPVVVVDMQNEGHFRPMKLLRSGNKAWIMCRDGSLRCWDVVSGQFVVTQRDFLLEDPDSIERIDMDVTENGDIWVMANSSLTVFRAVMGVVERVDIPLYGSDQFACIDIDSEDRVWLGSSKSGLRIIDSRTLSISHFSYIQTTSGRKISHNTDISDIFIDKYGTVWIAAANEGILLYHRDMARIPLIDQSSAASGIFDWNVKCIEEDGDGTILFGTIGGLLRYNPQTGKTVRAFAELSRELCIGLFRDSKGRMWVGTFQNGVYCIENGRATHYRYHENYPIYVSYRNLIPYYNSVRTFFEDAEGNIWVSVYGGIGKINQTTGQIDLLSDKYPQISHMKVIRTICAMDDETLLVTAENGLFCYNTRKDSLYYDISRQMFVDRITKHNSTLIDSRKMIWFGTHEGLFIWSSQQDSLYKLGLEEGLPENIQGIEEDDNGDVWLSSPNIISRITVKPGTEGLAFYQTSYDTGNGVQEGSFYEHSVLKASDGRIYFGGTHGVNVIRPSAMFIAAPGLTPCFSDFKVFNSSLPVGENYNGRVLLDRVVGQTDEIRLKYDENFVTFEFSGLNYLNPAQTYYRYRLSGFEGRWTEIKPDKGLGSVTYSFLNPGTYRFYVQASADSQNWSEPMSIGLTIMAPWWDSVFARVLYVLFAMLAVFWVFMLLYRRSLKRMEAQRVLERQKQSEELVQFKLKFFTNISHELKTPLSLIITPLDPLIKRCREQADRKLLETVKKNAVDLLDMVNTLLDFRKIEMNSEHLHQSLVNVVEYTGTVCESFRTLSESQKVELNYESRIDSLNMLVDREKLGKILRNLLSNAFKFTHSGGSVGVILDCELLQDGSRQLVITVSDTGVGINLKDLDRIFSRFYQADNDSNSEVGGSGIGLHMVKEYVKLHHGTVGVRSVRGKGSIFTVRIPILVRKLDSAYLQMAGETAEAADDDISESGLESSEKKHTVLLVEDNDDFRSYLVSELSGLYVMYQASDGVSGIEIAKREHIDLVITDVMMPLMNGVEMCRRLKTNIETSHIPVIMLTARDTDDSRISGYGVGADEFIAKPFNMDILLLRIKYLIDLRDRRIAYFSREIEVNPSEMEIPSLDEALIRRALQCVEENMDNPELSVEMLSSYIGMHRMNLYRKLQSILGQTPSVFIRSIRLKRAAQLLRNSELTVTEIAYMVGFSSLKYFGKYFKEEFGMTPTQYAEKNNDRSTERMDRVLKSVSGDGGTTNP